MIAATGLRWILSVLFALPVLYAIWPVFAPGRALAGRVDHLLHAVMGVLMIAMAWPWGMELATTPQLVLFVAGALWFACSAAPRTGDEAGGARLLAALPHVVMMAGMAWMVAVMDPSAMSSSGGSDMADMPGMDMSGVTGAATMTLTGTGQRWTAGLLALVLVALGLRWLARAFDRARAFEPVRVSEGAGAHGAGAHGAGRAPASEGSLASDGVRTSEGSLASDGVRMPRRRTKARPGPAPRPRPGSGHGTDGALGLACHAAMALGMAEMFVLLL